MLGKTSYLCNFVKIKGKSIFPPTCAERKLIATLLRALGFGERTVYAGKPDRVAVTLE